MNNKLALLMTLVLAACGDGSALDASVPPDAGDPPDSGADAGEAPAADAAVESDAAPEGDLDRDGLSATDCDDGDPAVGTSAARPCSSPCGAGEEVCTNGAWASCDAPSDCVCDTDGSTRVAACGACGMQAQRCVSGRWQDEGGCLYQGACMPGARDVMPSARCGEWARLCTAECTWGGWTVSVPDADCAPGDSQCVIGASDNYYCGPGCIHQPLDAECNFPPEP